MRLLGTLSLLILQLSACQAAPAGEGVLVGAWGGRHVGLELAAGGGALDYDCAAGTIDEPVRIDASGRFTARGTHTPGMGGLSASMYRVSACRLSIPAASKAGA